MNKPKNPNYKNQIFILGRKVTCFCSLWVARTGCYHFLGPSLHFGSWFIDTLSYWLSLTWVLRMDSVLWNCFGLLTGICILLWTAFRIGSFKLSQSRFDGSMSAFFFLVQSPLQFTSSLWSTSFLTMYLAKWHVWRSRYQ